MDLHPGEQNTSCRGFGLDADERCRYDEVRVLYLEQLAFAWVEDSTTEATRANVKQKIDSFADGCLEHATEIIVALLEIASKDGYVKSPASTSSDVRSSWLCLLS